MATHSSILACRIPWMEERGRGYSPWGRKESDTIVFTVSRLFHFSWSLVCKEPLCVRKNGQDVSYGNVLHLILLGFI